MPFVVDEPDSREISFFHPDRAFRRYDPLQAPSNRWIQAKSRGNRRPARGRPAGRADVPARPHPHRRAAVLPLHRDARPGAYRTPDPCGHENPWHETTLDISAKTAAAPRPPPPASSRSSPGWPATTSPTGTETICRPSSPNSPSYKHWSSTCSRSPTASIRPDRGGAKRRSRSAENQLELPLAIEQDLAERTEDDREV